MKFLSVVGVFLTSLTLASAAPSKPATGLHQWSKRQTSTVSKPDGRLFNINGTTQYFADQDVDTVMSEIAATELKVVRVWAFGSVNTIPQAGTIYFQILNSTGSYLNTGADGLARLDAVVASAETHGIQLVLPFTNNWSDLGGIPSYNAAFGDNGTSWYTSPPSQTAYRAYIEAIVNRYKNSSAIFAWELCNEPRCQGCDTSVITNWAANTSSYVKSLDSAHMVTLGDEGWFAPADGVGDGSYAYGGDVGVDFTANLKIETLDYGTFHLYPDSWGYNYTWGSTWIEEHDQIGSQIGKPVVLEEYGSPFPHNHTGTEAPWQTTVVNATQVAYDSFWQFATINLTSGSQYDVNSIWYNDTEYTVLARQHAADMLAKKVS
ncbi:MAG: hypothetical protein Q9165_005960 [Trypethelium subeluteriae]